VVLEGGLLADGAECRGGRRLGGWGLAYLPACVTSAPPPSCGRLAGISHLQASPDRRDMATSQANTRRSGQSLMCLTVGEHHADTAEGQIRGGSSSQKW